MLQVFVILIFSFVLFADQSDWGEVQDFEVINLQQTQKDSFSEYWDKHFYGSIAGTYSQGENHVRNASELKLGFVDHFYNFKFVLESSFRQNSINTGYNLIQSGSLSYTSNQTLNYQALTLRQAYFDFYPIKNLTISVGKQLNVWGQMEIFSPVDSFLPIDLNPMGFSLIKAENRMPQNTVRLSYYPISEIEVSGFFFPMFEESDLYKSWDFSSYYTEFDGSKYYLEKIIPSGRGQASSAIRVMWYSTYLVSALTYYDGYNHVFPFFRRKYIGAANDSYYFQNEYGYYPKRGIGFELNIPMGKISIKAEATVSDYFEQINTTRIQNSQIISAINSYNSGYDTIPIYQGFFSIGIDADFDDWYYNFYLMSIQYYKNPNMNPFWNVYESVYGDYTFNPVPIFPSINLGRYFGRDKKGLYGVALGYFTGSLGLFAYISNEITESLSWGVSADAGLNFSDLSLLMSSFQSATSENGEYRQYKFIEPKVTFGLGYKL